MSVPWDCCVFSFSGHCNELIPCLEEPYRVLVCVCVFYWVRSGATINLYTYSEQVEVVRVGKQENCISTIWMFSPHFIKLFYHKFFFFQLLVHLHQCFSITFMNIQEEKHQQCLLFKPRNRVTVISMLTVRIGDWFKLYSPFVRQLHRI